MKKTFKYSLLAATLLATTPVTTSLTTPAPVQAAQKICDLGKRLTIPKNIRGTWYVSKSTDFYSCKTFKIGVHTFNGKTVYHRIFKKTPIWTLGPSTKTERKKAEAYLKATKNLYYAYNWKIKGQTYYTFASWNSYEGWDMFRPATMKINGKTVKYLKYSTLYTNGKYFSSKSLAKKH